MPRMNRSASQGGVAQLAATYGPLAPIAVELLLADRASLDADDVADALRGQSGAIDIVRLPAGAFGLAYLDYRTDFQNARQVPMRHLVSYSEKDGDREGREVALRETWDWPGAEDAVARSRAVLYVADEAGLQNDERLALFQSLVRVLVTKLPVLAIHWMASQRIVDPAKYVVPDSENPLPRGPVHVRVRPTERETIFDTLGLCAFGMPDLQVRPTDIDPTVVAGWLYECARHVFARGAFMAERDTIDGVDGTWSCHPRRAIVPPDRDVIELRRLSLPSVERMQGIRCPKCGWVPETLSRWECDCGFMWNTFDTRAKCPACDLEHAVTGCPACGQVAAHVRWYTTPP